MTYRQSEMYIYNIYIYIYIYIYYGIYILVNLKFTLGTLWDMEYQFSTMHQAHAEYFMALIIIFFKCTV